MTHSCILPHELFGSLYKFEDMFAHMFLGAAGAMDFCWEHSRSTDWYKRHPVFEVPPNLDKCVPIGIYGDDAGVFNNEKVLVFLWGGVIDNHPTLLSRLEGAQTYPYLETVVFVRRRFRPRRFRPQSLSTAPVSSAVVSDRAD